jgi:hypothetical protein
MTRPILERSRKGSSGGLSLSFWLVKPYNRKRPGGEPRRVLGLLQGGEICISIYVDPWEVGGPFDAPRASRRGKRRVPYGRCGTQPGSFLFCPLSVVLCESLNSIRTYVRVVCECDHRLAGCPRSLFWDRYSLRRHKTRPGQSVVKKL